MNTPVFQNPFSTRFVRPGVIPWHSTETSLSSLLLRLYRRDNRAIICGPHGSGKSTILCHLASEAKRKGFKIHCLRICSRLDAIRVVRVFATIDPRQSIVSIDSWELLGFLGWFLCRLAEFRGIRVVVTVHHRTWWNNWPVLLNTEADEKIFRQLVQELLAKFSENQTIQFNGALLKDVFQRHSGNLRESFFELYDHYELQCRTTLSAK